MCTWTWQWITDPFEVKHVIHWYLETGNINALCQTCCWQHSLTIFSFQSATPFCLAVPLKCLVVPGSICFKNDGKQRFKADLFAFHFKIMSFFYDIINSTVSSLWFLCKHILLMLAFELFPLFLSLFLLLFLASKAKNI